MEDWVSKCRRLEVQGCRDRGRPKKTWEQNGKCDMRKYRMQRLEPFDKAIRGVVVGLTVQPVQAWKKRTL